MADTNLSAEPLNVQAQEKELKPLMTKFSPHDLPRKELDVYRICKSGKLDREAFLTTYEETRQGLRPKGRNWSRAVLNPGTYSTSCNKTYDSVERLLGLLTRYHPHPVIAKGVASWQFGPVQETIERTKRTADSDHVDWWLYGCTNDPSETFHVVEREVTQEEAEQ